jgi:hypothetical protein
MARLSTRLKVVRGTLVLRYMYFSRADLMVEEITMARRRHEPSSRTDGQLATDDSDASSAPSRKSVAPTAPAGTVASTAEASVSQRRRRLAVTAMSRLVFMEAVRRSFDDDGRREGWLGHTDRLSRRSSSYSSYS